ncbi:hypothetical protein M0R45_035763 [Rubus argutus]|uniref:Protein kinase domain-containing protein n=1 Tax=Rubus argutus TaxID=59490 RepID=A0AAW1VUZ6_RUBAR
MESLRLLSPFLALLVISLFFETVYGKYCSPSSCGNIHNISYPFRLTDDPLNCGDPWYNLSCESNLTVLHLYSGKYYVQAINYNNFTIRVVDPGIDKNTCSSIPRYSLGPSNFSEFLDPYKLTTLMWCYPRVCLSTTPIVFFKCSNPVNSSMYVDPSTCYTGSSTNGTTLSQPKSRYGYVKASTTKASDFEDGCSIEWTTLATMSYEYQNGSYQRIHEAMAYGFELEWHEVGFSCGGWSFSSNCYPNNIIGFFKSLFEWIGAQRWAVLFVIGMFFTGRCILGVPFLIALMIYKCRRRHLSMYNNIEDFLQSEKNFIPIRYSYSNIKKMTSNFKDKLGEGGYGSVFKGTLRSGHFVAVKMLGKSNSNGQDFISEVATIGRIHHVNVVQLVGYCVEGSKRALVYDFMPNGSLDKYIYSKEGSILLSCKKTYKISIWSSSRDRISTSR